MLSLTRAIYRVQELCLRIVSIQVEEIFPFREDKGEKGGGYTHRRQKVLDEEFGDLGRTTKLNCRSLKFISTDNLFLRLEKRNTIQLSIAMSAESREWKGFPDEADRYEKWGHTKDRRWASKTHRQQSGYPQRFEMKERYWNCQYYDLLVEAIQ